MLHPHVNVVEVGLLHTTQGGEVGGGVGGGVGGVGGGGVCELGGVGRS